MNWYFFKQHFIIWEKGLKNGMYLIFIFTLIFLSIKFAIFGDNFQSFLKLIIPKSIWLEFSDFQYSRLEMWNLLSLIFSIIQYLDMVQVHSQKYSN